MRRVNAITGIVVAALGAYALLRAFDLQLTVENGVPGPGLFPALTSALLVVLGLLLVGSVFARTSRRRSGEAATESGLQRSELQRVAVVSAGFVISVVLLPVLGFLLTGVLLVSYLILGHERRRSIGAAAAVVLIPGLAYLIFVTLLGVRLPEGIFGQL
jgi:hypothetical protein